MPYPMNPTTLTEEIPPYTDGNGLLAPYIVTPGTRRASDNGPLFTAQYIILAKLNGEHPSLEQVGSLLLCVDKDGYLRRDPSDTSNEDAPDDHYGYLAALNVLGLSEPLLKLPLRCLHPALIYLRLMANNNPLRFLLSPIVALTIALSNRNSPTSDTSNRLLTWVLIQGTKDKSLLCKLAGKVWTNRLLKDYLGDGAGAARVYFQTGHPFVRYWKTGYD